MGKRGPKKRIDLEAVWAMRKRVERNGESQRSVAQDIARRKPYSWETLRKWYADLNEAGELPTEPPVNEAYEELVFKLFREFREGLDLARSARTELFGRLLELGFDPTDLDTEALIGSDMLLESKLENLAPLATSSVEDAVFRASRTHRDEESTLAAIRSAKIEYERLAEKRRVLRMFIAAHSDVVSLERKLNPENG